MTAELLQVLARAVNQLHQCCRENLSYEGQVALKGTVTLSTDITAQVEFYTNAQSLIGKYQRHLMGLEIRGDEGSLEFSCSSLKFLK